MIVRPADGRLITVTQNDHAHFSGELLSLWHRPPLPEHPRRSELLFAAREHDNGWREADSAPRCDPATGRPHTFLTMPEEVRLEIWWRGIRRFAERRPYASLLILSHARNLHRHHAGEPAWAETLARWGELAEELLETAGATAEEAAADYRWIDLTDHLSLAFCNGWEKAVEAQGFRFQVAAGELRIEPLPLAGATTFRIPCREIPDRRFRGDSDLAVELASARWRELTARVVPFEARQ